MKIAKISHIHQTALSGKAYFTSLLDAAQTVGLLSAQELDAIKMQCMELLAHKSHLYYSGDSSSIKTELAENILESIFYTLGVYLKTVSPDDAISSLLAKSIADIYTLGRRRIDTLLKVLRHQQNALVANMLLTPNETYTSTCKGAAPGFFKLYRPDYGAHEIHITADYPLYNPVTDANGIEFMLAYTEGLLLESQFCKLFAPTQIHRLMHRYHKGYAHLVINLFSQVLTNALGCLPCGTNPTGLLCPKEKIFALQSAWLLKSKSEIGAMLSAAAQKLLAMLGITDEAMQSYIIAGLPEITANVYLAVQTLTLDTVFVC